MIEVPLAGPNLAFTAALGLLLAIALPEGAGAVLGAGISTLLEGLIPDVDLDAAGPDAGPGIKSALLGWLYIGRAPVLILLIAVLFSFGVVGLVVQSAALGVAGRMLPGTVAVLPALALALPAVRLVGRGFARFLPREETYVVSGASFVGSVNTVTLGTASAGQPIEAKVKDRFGRSHYVRGESDDPTVSFTVGDRVLLISRHSSVFKANAATAALVDDAVAASD